MLFGNKRTGESLRGQPVEWALQAASAGIVGKYQPGHYTFVNRTAIQYDHAP